MIALFLPLQKQNDTCAWNPNNVLQGLSNPGLGTLATSNPGLQAIGSWARYLGLGTLAQVPWLRSTSNPGVQAIGSWARYLGLGTLAQVPWRRAAILIYRLLAGGLGTWAQVPWLRYPGDEQKRISMVLLYRTSKNPSNASVVWGKIFKI